MLGTILGLYWVLCCDSERTLITGTGEWGNLTENLKFWADLVGAAIAVFTHYSVPTMVGYFPL